MGPDRDAAGVVAVRGDGGAVIVRAAGLAAGIAGVVAAAGVVGAPLARADGTGGDAPVVTHVTRESLSTESAAEAWQRTGFRLGLAVGYGELVGLGGAPSGRSIAVKLRLGLRLDRQWSLLASFEYARASASGGLSGLRFAGTLDPTWHVTPDLSLAVGFGFGGIVEGRSTGRMDAAPLADDLETSYPFPDASTPIARCSGVGAAGLARVEWTHVLGPRAELAIGAEAIGQWTGCVDATDRLEPDTGRPIVRRQWWPHTGGMLSLGVTWR